MISRPGSIPIQVVPDDLVHVYTVPTMLTELLYPLQEGYTPLLLAAREGHSTCVERLLSTPGIDVNIKDRVSW